MPREIVYVGRKIQVAVETQPTADGQLLRRDVVLHPGAVVIVPLVDSERVVLLRNYRFVVEETLWELPAGTLETGEDLAACARRELAEETGYTAAWWHYHGFVYASPGVLNEKMHLFFARELTPGSPRPEEGEKLEPAIVPLAQALTMIRSGEIHDAKTVVGLLLWQQFYAESVR